MNEKLQISVIIPVYNKEKYIVRCMDSILTQTYKNLEVIVVDDGSIDSSLMLCREYAEMDTRVTVLTKRNGGVSSARNIGLEHVSGKLVTFVDPDDWLELTCFEELVDCLMKYNADIACCFAKDISEKYHTVRVHGHNTSNVIITRKEQVDWQDEGRSQCTVWGAIYKRNVIQGLTFAEDITIGEDTLFFAQAVDKMQTMVKLDKALYNYSLNDDSAVGEKWKESKLTNLEAQKRMKNLFGRGHVLYSAAEAKYAAIALDDVMRYYADDEFVAKGLSACKVAFREDVGALIKSLFQHKKYFELCKALVFWASPKLFVAIYRLRYIKGRKR